MRDPINSYFILDFIVIIQFTFGIHTVQKYVKLYKICIKITQFAAGIYKIVCFYQN